MILHHRDGRVCQERQGSFPRCPARPELPEALQKVVPEAVEEVVRRLARRVAQGQVLRWRRWNMDSGVFRRHGEGIRFRYEYELSKLEGVGATE